MSVPTTSTDMALPLDELVEREIVAESSDELAESTASDSTRESELPAVQRFVIAGGEAVVFSNASPAKATGNEDSWGIFEIADRCGLLAVADGLGGHRGGRNASQLVVDQLEDRVKQLQQPPQIPMLADVPAMQSQSGRRPSSGELQAAVLSAIEVTNEELIRRGSGSATTLAAVEIRNRKIRTYHIGDSEILIVGQRGRIKTQTVSHSPVGYALKAGIINEEEALYHEERHLVSNVVGIPEMRIEMGPRLELAARDTVLIASDGLFDNLWQHEIVEIIRKGNLQQSVRQLAEMASQRMQHMDPAHPSKPDDLTILAFRLSAPRRKRRPRNLGQIESTAKPAVEPPASDDLVVSTLQLAPHFNRQFPVTSSYHLESH